jgi:hypothetical protein
MSNTLVWTENRIETNSVQAVSYQLRLGTADSNAFLKGAQSTIVLAAKSGSNEYGMQFNNYDSATQTGAVNYITNVGGQAASLNLFTIQSVDTAAKATLNSQNANVDSVSSALISVSTLNALNLSTGTIRFNLASGPHISTTNISTSAIAFASAVGDIGSISSALISSIATTNVNFTGNTIVSAMSAYDAVMFQDNTRSNQIGLFLSTGTDYVNERISFVNNNTSNIVHGLEYLSNASGQDLICYANILSSIKATINYGTGTLSGRGASTMFISSGVGAINNLTVYNLTTTSDQRHKQNVAPFENAMATVAALEPVYYDWIGRENMRAGLPEVGFIAQAVNAVLPNIVAVDGGEEGTMSVGYDRLTAVLVGAVKELNARLAAVEARAECKCAACPCA